MIRFEICDMIHEMLSELQKSATKTAIRNACGTRLKSQIQGINTSLVTTILEK